MSILFSVIAGVVVGLISGIVYTSIVDYQIHRRVLDEDKKMLHFEKFLDNGKLDKVSVSRGWNDIVDQLIQNGWKQVDK